MADKVIEHTEIIERNWAENAGKSADMLLQKVNLLITGIKELSKTSAKKITLVDPKTIQEADQIEKATKKIDQLAKANERLEKEQSKLAKKVAVVNELTKEQRKENTLAAKAITVANDSLAAQRIELTKLRRRYDNLTAAERNNKKVGGVLLLQIRKLSNETNKLNVATGRTGRSMGKFGSILTKVLGAFGLVGGVLAFGRAITDTFRRIREFDKELQNMAGISGITRSELEDVEKAIIRVASTSIKTSNEVAKLATVLFALGKTEGEVKLLLKPVNDLSIALGATSEEAGELLVGTLNAFQKGAESGQQFADVIAKMRTSTSLNFERIKDSLGFVSASANALGLTIGTTGALIGVLQDNNIKAARAGRLLNTSFLRLAKNGKTLEDGLDEINKAQKEGATRLEVITKAGDLFGARAAALGLILANNRDRVAELTNEFDNLSEGSLKELTDEQLKSLDAQFKILDSTWEKFILDFDSGSGVIARGVRFIVQSITALIASFRSLDDIRDEAADKILAAALKDDRKQVDALAKSMEENGTPAIEAQRKAVEFLLESLKKENKALKDIRNVERAKNTKEDFKRFKDEVRRRKILAEQTDAQIEALEVRLDTIADLEENAAKTSGDLQDELTEKEKKAAKKKADALLDLNGKFLQEIAKQREEAAQDRFKKLEEQEKELQKIRDKARGQEKKDNDDFVKSRINDIETITEEIKSGNRENIELLELFAKRFDEIGEEAREKLKEIRDEDARLRKEEQQERIESARQTEEAIFEAFEARLNREKQLNSDRLSELDKQINFQQQLAIKGEKNTLDVLEKERAKALEEKQALDKKAAIQKEAEQLAEIFLEFMKVFASEKERGFGKALAATAKAFAGKRIVQALAGSFAGGVEDFQGKGTGTSDSNVIGFSAGESVTTAKGTAETPGLVTSVNEKGFKGAQDWAMEHVFPKIPMLQDKSRDEQVTQAMIGMLDKRFKSFEETLKKKKEIHVHRNILGELVIGEKENGIHKQTTVRNTPIINGR